jgi:hypothetical protein
VTSLVGIWHFIGRDSFLSDNRSYNLDVLTKQMKECPQDFFYEILSEDNFVSQVLKVSCKKSMNSEPCWAASNY